MLNDHSVRRSIIDSLTQFELPVVVDHGRNKTSTDRDF